jgi:hypothetical protein
MFHLIYNVAKSFLFSLLLQDYIYRNYPEMYRELLLYLSYKLIYTYSRGQIAFNNTRVHLDAFLTNVFEKYPEIHDFVKKYIVKKEEEEVLLDFVEYILNSEQIHVEKLTNTMNPPQEYDFLIVSQNSNNLCVNKRILKKIEDWDNSFENSDVQFVLVEINIPESYQTYKINFKTDYYNFYLVNNRIDEKFLKYFLKNYTKEGDFTDSNTNITDMKNITLTILDHNVNSFNINISEDYIHFTKTNYYRKSDIITED